MCEIRVDEKVLQQEIAKALGSRLKHLEFEKVSATEFQGTLFELFPLR
jgi:hypothetical protein